MNPNRIVLLVLATGSTLLASCAAPQHPGDYAGQRVDRIENKYDRAEDRYDRRHYSGPGDFTESRYDRRENKYDRAEDRMDRRGYW